MIRALTWPVPVAASVPAFRSDPKNDSSAGKTRVSKMLTYITNEGNSKCAPLSDFRPDHTTPPPPVSTSTAWSFVGYWNPRNAARRIRLIYTKSFPTLAASRCRIVKAFQVRADPEWPRRPLLEPQDRFARKE